MLRTVLRVSPQGNLTIYDRQPEQRYSSDNGKHDVVSVCAPMLTFIAAEWALTGDLDAACRLGCCVSPFLMSCGRIRIVEM
jgi:hypothetical protein